MKAILIDDPGPQSRLRLAEVPSPNLAEGQVRIRVEATAVNRADLLQRRGLYPPPPGASEILGLECAGEVVEVGAGVGGWKRGDRVMALLPGGGYAEEAVVAAGCLMPVPASLDWERAAALPEVFLTAYLNLFELGGLGPGGVALVHGGGSGVGTAAIQLVREAGARILVTAGSEEKCRRCRELGAERAIDYRREDFAAVVESVLGGRGVDAVLDAIGAPYLERNLRVLAVGGRLVVIGLMGGARGEIALGPLLARRLHLIGSTLRSRPDDEKAGIVARFWERFGSAIEAGRVAPVVDRVLPLASAEEAHRVMAASEHFGKIVLRVGAVSGKGPR